MSIPTWRRILIHHSGAADTKGVDRDSIRRYHTEILGWRDIGYHGVIEKIGDAYESRDGRPLTMIGAHCPGQNSIALGLCLVGNFLDVLPPSAQVEQAAIVCAEWCDRFDIAVPEIKPHREYRATACPGLVDVMQIRSRVVELLTHG